MNYAKPVLILFMSSLFLLCLLKASLSNTAISYYDQDPSIATFVQTLIIFKPYTTYTLTGHSETPGGYGGNALKVSSPIFPGESLWVNKVIFHFRCMYLNST